MVSVGVGGVVAGTEERENGSGAGGGAGTNGPATTGDAKLDALGKKDGATALDTTDGADQTELVTAGKAGNGTLDEADNAEPAKIGEAADKIGSAFLVLAALGANDRKATNISSALLKNILSRRF